MSPMLISICVFVGVAALIVAVAVLLRDKNDNKVEDRLALLMGNGMLPGKDNKPKPTLLAEPMDGGEDFFQSLVKRFARLKLLFEQADTKMTPLQFFVISGGLAAAGALAAMALGGLIAVVPAALGLSVMPLVWLMYRRSKRLKMFATQLPDALELISRALRAGHSLSAGFNLVQEEMPAPIGTELGRVFEEQNLGIPLDEALSNLTDRIPNLDLKFFATAVILQRQTGGDLAEILDKIGSLIRERFKIWGQVQALTGEGRLSGVVLLALPPLLFVAVFRLNREYIMALFTDPMGKKMLAVAIVMQLLGALVIRKIVNIKV
ncbi:MAG: type II secretion system F family protein [Pirellulales bacterium]|nr:type II secretion system F family protein [Pirellulales bacterium]